MRVGQLKELERLEESLASLATIGSTSPYVGLFGTVWGIMNSFVALGGVQQATLQMVAPGIAEALIATAMGLFAAIPAVIAYNRYADQVSRLELRYDAFMEEFSTILQRYAGRGRPSEERRHGRRTTSRRRRKLMGEINVVPYIDVMLVLLIIFMITAPLLAEGIKVELPKAGARPIPPEMLKDSKPIVLTIDDAGRLFLNYGASRMNPSTRPRSKLRAAAVLRRAPETAVLVRGDYRVAYGEVVGAMTILQRAGASKVGFITQPPEQKRAR